MEWFTGVTVVEAIWPVICTIDKWLSPSIDLFIPSHTIPEKDLSKEGDMNFAPRRIPWQNSFDSSYIDSFIYLIIIMEYLLLGTDPGIEDTWMDKADKASGIMELIF